MKNFPVHGQNNYLLLKKLKNQNVAHPRFVVICKIQAIALKWWKQHINSIIYIDTAALRTRGQNLDKLMPLMQGFAKRRPKYNKPASPKASLSRASTQHPRASVSLFYYKISLRSSLDTHTYLTITISVVLTRITYIYIYIYIYLKEYLSLLIVIISLIRSYSYHEENKPRFNWFMMRSSS